MLLEGRHYLGEDPGLVALQFKRNSVELVLVELEKQFSIQVVGNRNSLNDKLSRATIDLCGNGYGFQFSARRALHVGGRHLPFRSTPPRVVGRGQQHQGSDQEQHKSRFYQKEARMAEERHFKISEIAKVWGFSYNTVMELFRDEPGVLTVERPRNPGKRAYTSIRVPVSVVERVYRQRVSA